VTWEENNKMMGPTDSAFLDALEKAGIPNDAFRHRDHLRAAWLCIRQQGAAGAEEAMLSIIRRFATAHGHAGKFHYTLTVAWVRLVAAHVVQHNDVTFEELIALDGRLLDKDLPLRFYSRDLLFSARAREQWVNPDREALPGTA
jgi:hypothetical protein